MYSARLFGIFSILSFIAYAIGIGLMDIIQNPIAKPSDIIESKSTIVIGAILIAIVHTLLNLGLLIIMFNVLKFNSKRLSILYLALGSIATLMLALGSVFLLLPIPIGEAYSQTNHFDASFFSTILQLATSGNFYLYQFGMAIWGCGGLTLCYLLHKSKLVPALFPILGSMGYAIFIVGCFLELFGIPYGVALSISGGLFEIALSVWLIVKGFNEVAVFSNDND